MGTPKTGGRQKGTPNKSTQDLQELMNEAEFNPYLRLMAILPGLELPQQVKVCMDLMGYVYPRRKAVELTAPGELSSKCPNCERIHNMTSEERQTRIQNLSKIFKETEE